MTPLATRRPIGIRWTIGDVTERGFEALRLSTWGAWHLFGPDAAYVVCVNTVPLAQARERTGPVPDAVRWHDANHEVPAFLAAAFGPRMAHGMGWKLAPLRLFPDRYELSLDNDCILWSLPAALRDWLDGPPDACVMAEDVRGCYGLFELPRRAAPRNAGIRGLPPGFDLEGALRATLAGTERELGKPLVFDSDLDEQGLQVVALSGEGLVPAVSLDDVTVCSPFHPHLAALGRCGAHFVGLNAHHIPFDYYGRPAAAWMTEHWERHRPALYARTGMPVAELA